MPPDSQSGLSRKILRAFAITLALVETAVFLLLTYLGLAESDTTFRIASTIAKLAAVPFFLGVLPALVLALLNRALRLSAARRNHLPPNARAHEDARAVSTSLLPR
jgi:hypothetical protein